MKIAATLDGRTALASGASQWITGAEARKDGHRWRARACANHTGIGTLKADNPRLTVRDIDTPRQPLRVVVDSRLEMDNGAKVLPALVFHAVEKNRKLDAEMLRLANPNGKVDLPEMLKELGRRGVNELHVEAGFKLNGSLVREGCVDEFLIYLNPSLLGDGAQGMVDIPGVNALAERVKLNLHSVESVGGDIRVVARL
jgi:diaminohydroxyphosphoribosylaminopyrimidine deaminase/5-amino-6-(5-phosphoribosylamino)uracil reductase